MRRCTTAALGAALAMTTLTFAARADEASPVFVYDDAARPQTSRLRAKPPRLTLDATTGAGAPGGLLSGGAAVYLSELAIAGGAGISVDGPQVYAGARVHPISLGGPSDRLGVGAFWSTGSYATSASAPRRYFRTAHWVSVEASVLTRVSPWELRVFAGAAFVLDPDASVCTSIRLGSSCAHPFTWVPYVGIGGSFGVL